MRKLLIFSAVLLTLPAVGCNRRNPYGAPTTTASLFGHRAPYVSAPMACAPAPVQCCPQPMAQPMAAPMVMQQAAPQVCCPEPTVVCCPPVECCDPCAGQGMVISEGDCCN